MFVDAEVDRPVVPASCCKKDQYGKYINQEKCQGWILGPPYKQSGPLNEAVFYNVFPPLIIIIIMMIMIIII